MTHYHKRSWPAQMAAKLLLGVVMLLLGGIFGAALLLQAAISDRKPPDTQANIKPLTAHEEPAS